MEKQIITPTKPMKHRAANNLFQYIYILFETLSRAACNSGEIFDFAMKNVENVISPSLCITK